MKRLHPCDGPWIAATLGTDDYGDSFALCNDLFMPPLASPPEDWFAARTFFVPASVVLNAARFAREGMTQ
jgi:hypothetical protein